MFRICGIDNKYIRSALAEGRAVTNVIQSPPHILETNEEWNGRGGTVTG